MNLDILDLGVARRQPYCGYVAPPTHFQKYINIFGNVHVYDMYKEWNWEINILYLVSIHYFVVDN